MRSSSAAHRQAYLPSLAQPSSERVGECFCNFSINELANQILLVTSEIDDSIILGTALELSRIFLDTPVTRMDSSFPTICRLITIVW